MGDEDDEDILAGLGELVGLRGGDSSDDDEE